MAKILHKKQTKHGYHGTKIYQIWSSMVKRCENKKSSNYKYYGGRGIKVCEEWRMSPKYFCDWSINNGFHEGLTIDRIDIDGDYEPNNVQFISHKENCQPNKRRLRSDNKTGYTGITKNKHGKFEVYHQIEGTQKYIGVRKTLEEAIMLKIGLSSTTTPNY